MASFDGVIYMYPGAGSGQNNAIQKAISGSQDNQTQNYKINECINKSATHN